MTSDRDRKALWLVVDRFLEGDSRQFAIIKAKITQYVHHQRVPAEADADEIVSEVLDILYHNLKASRFRGDSISALNVYIYRIIKFRINRILRTRGRMIYCDDQLESAASDRDTPEDAVVSHDLVTRILESLDPRCKQLLHMKFQRGWSDQEIANKMSKTKNATSTAISRCLDKTRELDIVKELK